MRKIKRGELECDTCPRADVCYGNYCPYAKDKRMPIDQYMKYMHRDQHIRRDPETFYN